MSRVDLSKNRTALLAAYEDVNNLKCKITWVVYGYEGQTNSLRVVENGDGDLEEMVEELNSGKVMYAYVRVKDPNTNLNKFLFVNWQGEGVPENKKGIYASHAKDVQNFFRGAHVTINARTEEDLDTDTVMAEVAKSSGSNYSFHQEKAQPEEEAGPVGSVYKKVRPHVEIRSNVRDKFWEKAREEERERQEEEKKRQAAERGQLDKERREREAEEGRQRELREADRIRKINTIKDAEKRANAPSKVNKAGWEEQQREALRDAEERRTRSEEMKKQRAEEAASLVGSRQNNPRAMFEQKPASIFDQDGSKPVSRGPPPPRKLKHTFMENREESQPAQRKGPIQLPKSPVEESRPEPTPAQPVARAPVQPPRQPSPEPEPEPVRVASPPRRAASPPRRAASPPRREPSPPRREPSPPRREPSPPRRAASPPRPASPPWQAPAVTSPVSPTSPVSRNLMQTNLPPRPPSDDEAEEEDDWEEDDAPVKPTAVIAPAEAYEGQVDEAPAHNNQHISSPLEESMPTADDYGLCARALYDYQASDETEITFDPGEVITNIDMIDEGWWTGINPAGQHGMFPANYVELMS